MACYNLGAFELMNIALHTQFMFYHLGVYSGLDGLSIRLDPLLLSIIDKHLLFS